MQGPQTADRRAIEVTGLPEEAIQALEVLVAALRSQGNEAEGRTSYEDWSKALRAWVESHPKRETAADWSRENIYAGRGQ
jgi:hypothetical protein